MTRTFQDNDLLLWEAYATAPRLGRDQADRRGARIMFHCLTDRTRRARVLNQDDDRTGVENRVANAEESELTELLNAAESLE
ncbi:MAG: hypothetical protein ACN0LA_13175 [Candidatus Longimicrobiales bacterium M2_2A_002]